jgi:integrase
VFVNTRGHTPHLSSFTSQTWKSARARIGRPDLRWHDLRHAFEALRIAAGAHPKQSQEEAGHASYNTTMNVYGNLFETLGDQVADAMEAINLAGAAAGSDDAKMTRLDARMTRNPSKAGSGSVKHG